MYLPTLPNRQKKSTQSPTPSRRPSHSYGLWVTWKTREISKVASYQRTTSWVSGSGKPGKKRRKGERERVHLSYGVSLLLFSLGPFVQANPSPDGGPFVHANPSDKPSKCCRHCARPMPCPSWHVPAQHDPIHPFFGCWFTGRVQAIKAFGVRGHPSTMHNKNGKANSFLRTIHVP